MEIESKILEELGRIRRLLEQANIPKLAYSREEVADMVGMSVRQVDRLTTSGDIPSRKIGGKRIYPKRELMSWLGIKE